MLNISKLKLYVLIQTAGFIGEDEEEKDWNKRFILWVVFLPFAIC